MSSKALELLKNENASLRRELSTARSRIDQLESRVSMLTEGVRTLYKVRNNSTVANFVVNDVLKLGLTGDQGEDG